MTDFDRPTELIVELAQTVAAEMRASYPAWKEAFIRMEANDGYFEVKGSYVLPSDIQIIDVLAHKLFFPKIQRIGAELRENLPHSNRLFCVAILRIRSDLNYEMQYEYKDSDRWRISKLKGGTGMPVGYIPA